MPLFQIKCRFTGAIRFEGEFGSLRLCVEAAVKAGANLARANLAGANLAGANLAGADLADAYLADAYLADADLAGANLAGANLARANLARANLARANLAGANLARAIWRAGIKLRSAPAKEVTRSDGHRFFLLDCEGEPRWRVSAGCRFFTMEEAWAHWLRTRDKTPLGEETFDLLTLFEHHIERLEAA